MYSKTNGGLIMKNEKIIETKRVEVKVNFYTEKKINWMIIFIILEIMNM